MGNTNLDVKRIKRTYLLVFTSEFHINSTIYTVSIEIFFQTRKFILCAHIILVFLKTLYDSIDKNIEKILFKTMALINLNKYTQ